MAFVEVRRHEPVEGTSRRQLPRLDADDAPVRADAGAQVRLRAADVGARTGETGFGLGDVGPGDLADIEAVAGLAQLLLEHLDVVAAQFQGRRVAEDRHVDLGGVEQGRHLGGAQRFARAEHVRLGPTGLVVGLKAVEQGLVDRQPGAAGLRHLIERDAAHTALTLGQADIGVETHGGAVAGLGLRDVLIGSAQSRTRGVQRRVGAIGTGQRAIQRLGHGRRGGGERQRGEATQP